MGMDVSGNNPRSDVGEYFRNNVWWWRPLADYCITTAPDICDRCKHWHSNDGDGLSGPSSVELADKLQATIDDGSCAKYAEEYDKEMAALPSEPCRWCDSTGVRKDNVGVDQGQSEKEISLANGFFKNHPRFGQTGWCNGCDGTGAKENWGKSYPFSVENVQEFTNFLRESGGFSIN